MRQASDILSGSPTCRIFDAMPRSSKIRAAANPSAALLPVPQTNSTKPHGEMCFSISSATASAARSISTRSGIPSSFMAWVSYRRISSPVRICSIIHSFFLVSMRKGCRRILLQPFLMGTIWVIYAYPDDSDCKKAASDSRKDARFPLPHPLER